MSDVDLNFYVLGYEEFNVFAVTSPRETKISNLMLSIQERHKQGTGDQIRNLRLYPLNKAADELGGLTEPTEARMKPFLRISNYWPGEIQDELVHILVCADVESRTEKFAQSHHPPTADAEAQDVLSELPSIFQRLEIGQEATARGFLSGKTASEAAGHIEFAKQQAQEINPIFNGRPYERTALPVQLYHPVFDTFLQELEKTDHLSDSEYRKVEGLLYESQKIYATEELRWGGNLRDRFAAALNDTSIHELVVEKCKADGAIIAPSKDNSGLPDAYCAIIEVKNEVGTGACDPVIQGAESYAIYWSQPQKEQLRHLTCCPSFIIAIAGPWMCILGAVYLKNVVVQPLTDYLCLASHPQRNDRLKWLTRVFHALSVSLGELRKYYHSLPPSPSSTDESRFFPYIRQFHHDEQGTVHFTYERCLFNSAARPIFKALTRQGRHIVVKFVQGYHAEAHRLLAAERLAPELLFAGGYVTYGGLRMIVMEYLDGMDLYDFIVHPQQLGTTKGAGVSSGPRDFRKVLASVPDDVKTVVSSVRDDVQRALGQLHDRNLVFGDLRPPNVFVAKRGDGELGGMLLDFDWCGTHNEARYPPSLNELGIEWPNGVKKGALMAKEHDTEMFGKMFL